jgi:2-iminobutanoate/2-iminopropanoate deaminase
MDDLTRIAPPDRQVITGTDLPSVTGAYSLAVRAGNLVFVSGQAGVDPLTDQLPTHGGFEAECRQAFRNVVRILEAAEVKLTDVVKVTILYVDATLLPIINRVQAEFFPVDPPARSSAIVQLALGRRITIDAIAALPE